MKTHKQVFSIYLHEAQRDAWGHITNDWSDWRSQWCDEEGYQKCELCGRYGELGEEVHFVNNPQSDLHDAHWCLRCVPNVHEINESEFAN